MTLGMTKITNPVLLQLADPSFEILFFDIFCCMLLHFPFNKHLALRLYLGPFVLFLSCSHICTVNQHFLRWYKKQCVPTLLMTWYCCNSIPLHLFANLMCVGNLPRIFILKAASSIWTSAAFYKSIIAYCTKRATIWYIACKAVGN